MLAFAALVGASAILTEEEPLARALLALLTMFFALLGWSFTWLRIEDEGQRLLVRYGPLPFFWTRIEYGEIDSVAPAKSTWIDGWGIHWAPGRGWTYNLWGFDCVELRLGKQTLRLGTDDAERLAVFLAGKVGRRIEPNRASGV